MNIDFIDKKNPFKSLLDTKEGRKTFYKISLLLTLTLPITIFKLIFRRKKNE